MCVVGTYDMDGVPSSRLRQICHEVGHGTRADGRVRGDGGDASLESKGPRSPAGLHVSARNEA